MKNDVLFYLYSEVRFDAEIASAVKYLCDQVLVAPETISPWCQHSAFIALMVNLLNQGYWFLAENE